MQPSLTTFLYLFLCYTLVKLLEISPWNVCLVFSLHAPVKSSLQHIMRYGIPQKWNLYCTTRMLMNISVPSTLLSSFNSTCASILNSIAPLKLRSHKSAPVFWHNETMHSQACRQAKCKWKKKKLQVSYEIMRNSLTMFQRAAKAAKCKYFSDLITKNDKSHILFPPLYSSTWSVFEPLNLHSCKEIVDHLKLTSSTRFSSSVFS